MGAVCKQLSITERRRIERWRQVKVSVDERRALFPTATLAKIFSSFSVVITLFSLSSGLLIRWLRPKWGSAHSDECSDSNGCLKSLEVLGRTRDVDMRVRS